MGALGIMGEGRIHSCDQSLTRKKNSSKRTDFHSNRLILVPQTHVLLVSLFGFGYTSVITHKARTSITGLVSPIPVDSRCWRDAGFETHTCISFEYTKDNTGWNGYIAGVKFGFYPTRTCKNILKVT